METESISGTRNGAASDLTSSLLSHIESVFPLNITSFKGVVGILSIILNWPFKKDVTGKIDTLSGLVVPALLLLLFFEWQEPKTRKETEKRKKRIFCIRKITNKKNRCRVRSNGLRKNAIKKKFKLL
jgi:hypothetical protein